MATSNHAETVNNRGWGGGKEGKGKRGKGSGATNFFSLLLKLKKRLSSNNFTSGQVYYYEEKKIFFFSCETEALNLVTLFANPASRLCKLETGEKRGLEAN